jgi:hypothetical protein
MGASSVVALPVKAGTTRNLATGMAALRFRLIHSLFANSEFDVTKPQDVVVALRLCLPNPDRSFAQLASELGMSASEVHASCSRLTEARLLEPDSRRVRRKAFLEFLHFGVSYSFPAHSGEVTRGIPTAWAAPVMTSKTSPTESVVPVWPDPDGVQSGAAVDPLYRSVPLAAKANPALYDLLALVDALRIGRARERKRAEQELAQRLSHEPAESEQAAPHG